MTDPHTSGSRRRTRDGEIRIGISGWTYKPWRGVFYPERMPHARELAFAAERFRSIEINGTFYSMQRPSSFARWAQQTPDDFVFSIKGPRFITHMLRLRNVEQALANFFASGILALGPKLGPILWQLPPNFQFDAERLESFFQLLPANSSMAAQMAERHHARFNGRVLTVTDKRRPIRHAMEIRHPSFVCGEFVRLLRKYHIALVCADTVAWPRLVDVTAGFVYCRLHGSEELYVSGYEQAAIEEWCGRVLAWSRGEEPAGDRILPFAARERRPHDVYVYFDNDAKVRAPADALALELCVGAELGGPSCRPLSS
ncbi:MAG: DUF72 domain-containing protein [Acidobacteriaceae bacterium]